MTKRNSAICPQCGHPLYRGRTHWRHEYNLADFIYSAPPICDFSCRLDGVDGKPQPQCAARH